MSSGAPRCHIARIVVFAFDLTEASQRRRVASFRRLGHEVVAVGFRRGNMDPTAETDVPTLELGHMPNRRFLLRLLLLLASLPRLLLAGGEFRRGDVLVARNFDMLSLAWVASLFWRGPRPAVVYECLDIHGLFTRPGPVGRTMRFLERRLLARIDLLWVSSPGFLSGYFGPFQGYSGHVALVENKLWFDGETPPRPRLSDRERAPGPITLGWVGSIRCRTSLDILTGVAERLGPGLRIAVHGNIHRHALPDFDARIAPFETITHHGPYRYPGGLASIYLGCDLVWAQDLWQRGANSDWLLPNRIYEAGWYGCPSIAVGDTETGRRVASDGLGFVIARPDADDLAELLATLDRPALDAASARLLAREETAFRLTTDDVRRALEPVLGADAGESSRPLVAGA